jgi:hypothetical protein
MADEKIKISWDEVQSPQVDVRIKQQQMLDRAQEHYQQQTGQNPFYAPPAAATATAAATAPVIPPIPRTRANIWYNSPGPAGKSWTAPSPTDSRSSSR